MSILQLTMLFMLLILAVMMGQKIVNLESQLKEAQCKNRLLEKEDEL